MRGVVRTETLARRAVLPSAGPCPACQQWPARPQKAPTLSSHGRPAGLLRRVTGAGPPRTLRRPKARRATRAVGTCRSTVRQSNNRRPDGLADDATALASSSRSRRYRFGERTSDGLQFDFFRTAPLCIARGVGRRDARTKIRAGSDQFLNACPIAVQLGTRATGSASRVEWRASPLRGGNGYRVAHPRVSANLGTRRTFAGRSASTAATVPVTPYVSAGRLAELSRRAPAAYPCATLRRDRRRRCRPQQPLRCVGLVCQLKADAADDTA